MALPLDYEERVYAGILGKVIGVYLGRPFEGWSHKEVLEKLGEVDYYVHDRLGVPLVVTDDDISGTFTFLRALQDYGYALDTTPAQIGQTWMNYIIENRTILWWGGLGMSTEHTAFLRMKHGIRPPASGSIATNGKVVAEQIGAQIFIDGWGLVNPGNPERAADFARRAGSVSHDGEAIYSAQVVASMIAHAFVESDFDVLLDTAIGFITKDSVIYRMIADIRGWKAQGLDWRSGFAKIDADYGYDKYGGNCHTVPNHAIIIHALLHSGGDFQRALMTANTCGWDTDCNSGNVGCIMGVRKGLAGFDSGPDWRGPVADKIYLPTADGGRCITDAATETYHVVNAGRALEGLPLSPLKKSARFNFELPGSVQGFEAHGEPAVEINNFVGGSDSGMRSLEIRFEQVTPDRGVRVTTDTFPSQNGLRMPGYELVVSPTLYSGQTVRVRVAAGSENAARISACLTMGVYGKHDFVHHLFGPAQMLAPGEATNLEWTLPDTGGYPIQEIGISLASPSVQSVTANLDYLTWDGTPAVTFKQTDGTTWKRQWVCGVSKHATWGEPFRLVQNEGTGLLITGCREWTDFRVKASVTPHLVVSGGIAARVQGMKRYYALLLIRGGGIRLVKALEGEQTLDQAPFDWDLGETHDLAIEVEGNRISGFVNGQKLVEAFDHERPLESGAIALVLTEGRIATQEVRVEPL